MEAAGRSKQEGRQGAPLDRLQAIDIPGKFMRGRRCGDRPAVLGQADANASTVAASRTPLRDRPWLGAWRTSRCHRECRQQDCFVLLGVATPGVNIVRMTTLCNSWCSSVSFWW
jgi:hypothetical protein